MAFSSSSSSTFHLIFTTLLMSFSVISSQQPVLDSLEQDSVYRVLDSVNPTIPWRSLFPPDYDLCSSPPHGIVCDYFTITNDTDTDTDTVSSQAEEDAVHVTELSFGYVSDYSPNPPCYPNSTLSPLIFTSFKYLRKLFLYECFTGEQQVPVPDYLPASLGSSLEELVFVNNPSLVGSLGGIIGNFTSLRRLVMTGNGVYGSVPEKVGDLFGLEEMTLSRNKLSGGLSSFRLDKLTKLKILDLSQNYFEGNVPEEMGNLTGLLKLDLSHNVLSGKIPESFSRLKNLEFMDLSFNHFGNFGVPKLLGKMEKLREVYLSGNFLGGQIPEIWEKLGGIIGIGLSGTGLVGKIPASMVTHLKNLNYLGLDNNRLEGNVPEELFGVLEFVGEINLENNNLSGRVPFDSKKVGQKLKLKGNPDLCVDGKFSSSCSNSGYLKPCKEPYNHPNAAIFNAASTSNLLISSSHLLLLIFLGFVAFSALLVIHS